MQASSHERLNAPAPATVVNMGISSGGGSGSNTHLISQLQIERTALQLDVSKFS